MIVEGGLEGALGKFEVQYATLRDHIDQVHRDVTTGASAADRGFLTDHGVQHIETVIARASALSRANRCELTEYEVFLLLAAIQLHDVGNIHGRKAHQITAQNVANWLGASLSRDAIVQRTVLQIASAHTAGDSAEKDTIGRLQPKRHILNKPVRLRLLASILRLADELADERRRASRYLLESGKLPTAAEVHHAFSHALHSVIVNHSTREIELHFDLQGEDAVRKFGKNDSEVYLLDEILTRSLKLHLERIYAMSFLRDWIPLDAVRVFVEVYNGGLDPIEKVGYRLAEGGYPDEPNEGVYSLVPELGSYREWEGSKVEGATLAQRISKRLK